ncbi:MAG: ATP-binding cassette domain-containing protein [Holosporaceae bacterium]|jgi:polar amino acid transport system ATP-binding protein|nr:ATP-binding cassette domain-containing protein [Holosporaceae bacterium]
MIKVNNANKCFGGVKVLDGISVSVEKSDVLGLAGPSGSGKSTLLRCLQGLETLDSGSLECNGKTGFMFQDFQLFPHMTVLGNLVYAPNLNNKDVDCRRKNEERARETLKNLGVESKMHEYPGSLSGGQKQRVALARSLMVNPDILLCDEPTSGLDVATTTDVVTLLKSVGETGVTMIIASHDLDFLTQISDRIILLKDGKIAVDVRVREQSDPVGYLKKYYVGE